MIGQVQETPRHTNRSQSAVDYEKKPRRHLSEFNYIINSHSTKNKAPDGWILMAQV